MADNENRPTVLAAIIVGLCLLVGLTAAGYFIGRGTARFKVDARTVTVKGLVEKEVQADEAVWTLSLRRANDDLKDAHAKISADREAVLAFLQSRDSRTLRSCASPLELSTNWLGNTANNKEPIVFATLSPAPLSCAHQISPKFRNHWVPLKSYSKRVWCSTVKAAPPIHGMWSPSSTS